MAIVESTSTAMQNSKQKCCCYFSDYNKSMSIYQADM